MRRHGNLFASITAFDTLLLAAHKAQRGKQQRSSVAHFVFHLEPALLALQDELRVGTYRMQPYRSFVIYEPKRRQICAAAFRDRVVHHAICHVLDPLFDASLISDTYACRRGKGTHAAVKRVQALARSFPYVLKCDIRHYFETMDHMLLKTLLRRLLKDQQVLALFDHIIDHPLPGGTPGKGVPIGNLTSQYCANLYLGVLDHFVKERLRLRGYVRYMDDFLVLTDNKPLLHTTLATIRAFLRDTLQLDLKDEVVRIAPVTQGVSFVGFRIFPGLLRLDRRKWTRFRHQVRVLEAQYARGMIAEETLAQAVASMIGHVQHADALTARRQVFAASLFLG